MGRNYVIEWFVVFPISGFWLICREKSGSAIPCGATGFSPGNSCSLVKTWSKGESPAMRERWGTPHFTGRICKGGYSPDCASESASRALSTIFWAAVTFGLMGGYSFLSNEACASL